MRLRAYTPKTSPGGYTSMHRASESDDGPVYLAESDAASYIGLPKTGLVEQILGHSYHLAYDFEHPLAVRESRDGYVLLDYAMRRRKLRHLAPSRQIAKPHQIGDPAVADPAVADHVVSVYALEDRTGMRMDDWQHLYPYDPHSIRVADMDQARSHLRRAHREAARTLTPEFEETL